MEKIRVLVADDNETVREELPKLLELDGDIEIVGAAGNGREAVDMVETAMPDVVVMDIKMPELDGIAATKIIHTDHPEIGVIMLSIYDTNEYLNASLDAGASNYLIKSTEIDSLANEIRRVFHNQETSLEERKQ